jgi:hypothetical protein
MIRPASLDIGKCRLAISDPDTPGLVLLTIALWAFGSRVFGDPENNIEQMDPSEMWAEFNELFGTWVTEEGENKLNAMILALESPAFYHDVETFLAVSNALFDGDLGDMVDGVFEEPSVVEMMWATLEVELARNDHDVAPPFSRQVSSLIAKKIREEQEDHSMHEEAVDAAFFDMLTQLRSIGVPMAAIRLLSAEHAEVMEALGDYATNDAI